MVLAAYYSFSQIHIKAKIKPNLRLSKKPNETIDLKHFFKDHSLMAALLRISVHRGPFLESPGKFSDPKSHFKNYDKVLDVQNFLFQQVFHLNEAYTFRI